MGIQNNINFRDEQSNAQAAQVSRLLIVYNIIKGKVSLGIRNARRQVVE